MVDCLVETRPRQQGGARAARDNEDEDSEEEPKVEVEAKSKKKLDHLFALKPANPQEERLIDYCLMFIRLLKNKSRLPIPPYSSSYCTFSSVTFPGIYGVD